MPQTRRQSDQNHVPEPGALVFNNAGFEADRMLGGVSSVKQTSKGGSSMADLSVTLTLHSICRSNEVTLTIVSPTMILSIIQLTAGTPALRFSIFRSQQVPWPDLVLAARKDIHFCL